MGRPAGGEYPASVRDDLLNEIANGRTMAEFCRRPGMPDRTTISSWIKGDEEFRRRYYEARTIGFDAIAERTRGTARGLTDEEGDSTGDWQRDKLIIETDLKLLAKWSPKTYGERVEVEHSGSIEDVSKIGDRLDALLERAFRALDAEEQDSLERW